MYLLHLVHTVPAEAREQIGSPRTIVMNSNELAFRCLELILSTQKEQSMLPHFYVNAWEDTIPFLFYRSLGGLLTLHIVTILIHLFMSHLLFLMQCKKYFSSFQIFHIFWKTSSPICPLLTFLSFYILLGSFFLQFCFYIPLSPSFLSETHINMRIFVSI